jgi:FkbM family methyltransferase
MPAKGDPGAYICQRVQPGDIVIDANEGLYTKQYAQIVGSRGQVYAFEPDTRCHDALYALPPGLPVVVVPCVAGDRHDTVTFIQSQQTQQSSLFSDAVTQSSLFSDAVTQPVGTQKVSMMPLDDVTLLPVAAIKIDVQGAEAAVLRGAKRLLQQCPLWVIELWPWGLRQAGETMESVVEPFAWAGLVPRYMSDEDPIPTPADLLEYCRRVEAPHEHINVAWIKA